MCVDKVEEEGNDGGGIMGLGSGKGEKVEGRVGCCLMSEGEGLEKVKELGNESFDVLVEKGKRGWNEGLGRMEVEGGKVEEYGMLYCWL